MSGLRPPPFKCVVIENNGGRYGGGGAPVRRGSPRHRNEVRRLGRRGRPSLLPKNFHKNFKKLPKIVRFAPYYIWGFYEKYDGKF